MDGLPDVGLGGLLRDIYRDLRKIVIGIFKVLLYIPIQICQRLKRKWELRQHRKNRETADVSEIWGSAKYGVLRRIKNSEKFLFYEYEVNYPKKTVNMLTHIEQSVENAKVSLADDPTGKFVIVLVLSQFFVDSELYEIFRDVVKEEIRHSFNRYFELDLHIQYTEQFIRSIQDPLNPGVIFV